MEFPRRALIGERVLGALALLAALGAAWAERRSTLHERLRDGRPWLAWVEARERGTPVPPSFHLAVYEPHARRLALLHVPGETKLEGKRTLDRAYREALQASNDPDAAARAAQDLALARLRALSPEPLGDARGRLAVELEALEPQDEPAIEAAAALRESYGRPGAWLRLARKGWRGLRAGDGAALDPLLFGLELRRLGREGAAPVRLPGESEAPALLARLLSPPPPDDRRADSTVVEVLNATPRTGLAHRAAKVLRSRGQDVQHIDSIPPRERSMVYDRSGDFTRAASVRDALGCPAARAMTRLDPTRAVDVSVELGEDCAEAFGPAQKD